MRNLALIVPKLRHGLHFLLQGTSLHYKDSCSLSLPLSLSQPPMNPDNTFSSQKLVKSQGHCIWKAGMEPLLCLTVVSEMHPQSQPHICKLPCDDLGQPWDFPKSLSFLWNLAATTKSGNSFSAAQQHVLEVRNAQMLTQCIRNASHPQCMMAWGKCWKDPALRTCADTAGVVAWVCFHGNGKKHSEELPHQVDETNCYQGKQDSHVADVLVNNFLT